MQVGTGSDYNNPTLDVQEVSFLLHILIKTFYEFQRNAIEYFQPRIQHEVWNYYQ